MPEQMNPSTGRPAARLSAILLVPVLLVPLLALGACGDNRSEAKRQEQVRSAKLVLPTTLTPPIHVGAISGAPAAWKLGGKVAWALRQRDIPASDGQKRGRSYRLGATLSRSGAGAGQLVIRWTLTDPTGKKVGEVTQMAALPPGQAPNEDILESIADAAAESLSPIIPSTKLQTARRFDTGEPTSRPPKEVDDKNRVTAVGKIKSSTPLSRNLLTRRKTADGKDTAVTSASVRGSGGTSVTTSHKSVTAIGRMGAGGSALSRNLIRGTGKAAARKPAPGGDDGDTVHTQSTTSRRPHRTASDTESGAMRGSMSELIRRYPTSIERLRSEGRRAGDGGTKDPVRRVADNREGIARDFTPRVHGQVADAGDKSAASRGSAKRRYVWWVQIGAYGSAAEGESQWSRMRGAATDQLFDKNHRVVRKNLGKKGIWYRLQVGPTSSKADALQLCGKLKAAGLSCFLVAERYRGDPPPPASRPKTVAKPPAKAAPPKVNRGETTSKDNGAATKPGTRPAARSDDPPAKGGNGISVYDWKTDKTPDAKDPPLSTRPGLPGVTQ